MSSDHFIIGPWSFSDVLWRLIWNLMFKVSSPWFLCLKTPPSHPPASAWQSSLLHSFALQEHPGACIRKRTCYPPYKTNTLANLATKFYTNGELLWKISICFRRQLTWSLRRPEVSCRWQFLPPASSWCSAEPRTPASVAGCCCAIVWAQPPDAGGRRWDSRSPCCSAFLCPAEWPPVILSEKWNKEKFEQTSLRENQDVILEIIQLI